MIIGVDEAGRGPVIGPLVVCAFAHENSQELLELGVADSKRLSKKKREELFEVLIQFEHQIIICPPSRIDTHGNLNDLEVVLFSEALKGLGIEGEIILDACDVNEERFAQNVSEHSGYDCDAEHGADDRYPVVGAASIIAKVTRDNLVKDLEKELGFEIGSGYPSDPKTKSALPKLLQGEKPHECLRWTWKTVANAWNGKVPIRLDENSPQQTLF
jgi:ribonuclease HII|tara:strand:- start:6556 stop:7200 length:645 start_codon:yes stop_codon:yes gene_type:complete